MMKLLTTAVALFAGAVLLGFALYVWDVRSQPSVSPANGFASTAGARVSYLMDREIAACPDIKPVTGQDGIGYLWNGDSSPSEIRRMSGAALAFAVVATRISERYPGLGVTSTASAPVSLSTADGPPTPARAAISLIRYLALTHRVGSGTATDGQKWGGSDAAAVDAANLGLAAHLVRSWLDDRTRGAVDNVVRFEAGRYLLSQPAAGGGGDSAGVSNAAAAAALCTAGALYAPAHARSAYAKRASDYGSLVLNTALDSTRDRGAGGLPSLFPDLTMQYGGAFSPSAELQVMGALAECALCYRLSGAESPLDIRPYVMDCWRRVMVKLVRPYGWFITGDAEVTEGGPAVSWLAAEFSDPAAVAVDGDAIERMINEPGLAGERCATPLLQSRLCETALSELIYRCFSSPSNRPSVSSSHESQSGVTWLPSASMTINRGDTTITSFSWISGAGQVSILDGDGCLQWRFAPGGATAVQPSMREAPAWSVGADNFATVGFVRLESGASVDAAVYSLPDGRVGLLERSSSSAEDSPLSIFRTCSLAQPSVTGDDARAVRSNSGTRWLDIDGNLGIVVLEGDISPLQLPGDDSAPRGGDWPIVNVYASADRTSVTLLAPSCDQRSTSALARSSRLVKFSDSGWAGAMLAAPAGGADFIVARFAGATSALVALNSDLGAPVVVEQGSVQGGVSSVAISSPANAARWEPVSCWLTVGEHGSLDAKQGREYHTASFSNPGLGMASVTVRYLSSGRGCTVTEDDGHTIVKVVGRTGLGEIHFSIGAGRSAEFKY